MDIRGTQARRHAGTKGTIMSASILLNESDGRQRRFDEAPPVTPPPPTTPPPVEPQTPSEPETPTGYTTIEVNPSNYESLILSAKPRTVFIFADGEYRRQAALNLKCSGLYLKAKNVGRAIFVDADTTPNDGARCAIGIGSLDRITIEGLTFDSPDGELRHRFNGINVSGRATWIRDCDFRRCYQGVYVTDKADGTLIEGCTFASAYGVYARGRDTQIESCKFNKCVYAGVRVNEVVALGVHDSHFIGDPGAATSEPSRITIQKADGVIVAENILVDTSISVGPLANCDGLRGEGSLAAFLAARTKNVLIEDNALNGKGDVTIGARTETIHYVGDESRLKKEFTKTIVCDGQTIVLPAAKDVWVNGGKVA